MDDATRVEWREWGEDAFAEARERGVPVLLSLTATWCEPCHEMDAQTYADPAIAAHIGDSFVPVRVDVDRQPRVRDRYAMGGFPSTVFLTPDGSLLTGGGYFDPDGLRQVLERVRETWRERGTDAGRIPRALREREPPAGDLDETVERLVLAALEGTHDEVAGGWGEAPKFPLPGALEFALKRDRAMALRSFEAVRANLLDEYEGGFYRFASERDWSGLHTEKLTDENAALLRAFANAYLSTGDPASLAPAERTLEYLTTTLWLPEENAFAASQAGGDPKTPTLTASDREAVSTPPVDETVFAGANALAVDALLTYAAYTDDERATRYAVRALETLRERLLEDGAVVHYRADGRAGERTLLTNQARVLRALLTAHSVCGPDGVPGALEDARRVAAVALEELREDSGAFVDGPTEGPGLLERPLRPIDGAAELANALVDLSVVIGEERYRETAHDALAAFAGASDRLGAPVAGYATAVSRLRSGPLVVRVGTPAGTDLHRAAFRLADHEKVVVPASDALESGTARVEHGSRVSSPATTPAELSERVSTVLE
ncbi:DUF255 domain-containing protein [Natronobiforma cellulositropha]|uniref:DUF255 domain-containing protein n=1 Tax=Natronobiforma cellulositropha TaxID=1679076 RepID=UPI0021D57E7B|nr:DUF255 domain-containing protein [Natronobiforma cellulositropha]